MARPSTRGGKRISVRLGEDAETGLDLLMDRFDTDLSDTVNRVLVMAARKLQEAKTAAKRTGKPALVKKHRNSRV